MRNFENKSNFDSKTQTHISEKKVEDLLNDLRKVGPEKPIGYLPLSTLTEICHVDPKVMEEELKKQGLKILILTGEETRVVSGALYVYSEESLSQFLKEREAILKKAGWPITPDSFIRHLKFYADRKTDLFDLIADAFGDKTNPGRKNLLSK